MGLTISKQLVELMGGEISVESEYGKGTTFFITITLARQNGNTEKKLVMPPDIKNLRVLAIDDCEESRSIINKILKSYGYQVEMVALGSEAIRLLEENQTESFDLILMDWMMPEMDGIETANRIRQDLKMDTPIILLTAYGKELKKKHSRELISMDF